MNSGMIAENIFSAIDVIVDKKLREAKYDSTIIAKIIKVHDSALGRYEVQYQDAKFVALSVGGGAYQVNDNVYILVPTNDLSRDKYILGLSNANRRITALGDVVTTAQLEAIIKRIEELEGQEIPQLPSLDAYAKKSDLNNYVTQDQLDGLNLGDKVTVTPQGTGTEIIATIKVNENSYEIKAPKTEVVEAGSTVTYQGTNAADGDTIGTLTIDDIAYDIKAPNLNSYAKTDQIPTTTSKLKNDSGFITRSDLNSYAQLSDIPKDTSDLNNDSGFITSSALDGYATQTWINNQGFLESDDLNGYARTSDIPDTSKFITQTTADNKYATKDEVSAMGNGDMLKSIYDKNSNNIIDKAEDANALGGVSADKYATQEWVQQQGYKTTDNNTTYTLSADTKNNKIVLTPSKGTAQSITVPYATKAGSATTADSAAAAQSAHSAENASKANALNLSAAVGSTTEPVYFNASGQPVAITNAKLTDTLYTLGIGNDKNKITLAANGVIQNELIVPYATNSNSATTATQADNATNLNGKAATEYVLKTSLEGYATTDSLSKYVLLTSVKDKGSKTQPVYFNANGAPSAIDYTIKKSVPADAIFTDTTYELSWDEQSHALAFKPSTATTASRIAIPYANNAGSLGGVSASNYATQTDLSALETQINGEITSVKTSVAAANATANSAAQIANSKNAIEVSNLKTSGTKIATMTIDGGNTGIHNIYVPTATTTTLGLVKIGSNLSVSNGVISAPLASRQGVGMVKSDWDGNEAPNSISFKKAYIYDGYIYYTDTNTTYTTVSASGADAGLMSVADKKKLDGIAVGATANQGTVTGVTLNGNSLISGSTAIIPIASRQAYGVVKSDYDGHISPEESGYKKASIYDGYIYYQDTDTRYSNATTSYSGLMSATDKTQLTNLPSNLTMSYSNGTLTITYTD